MGHGAVGKRRDLHSYHRREVIQGVQCSQVLADKEKRAASAGDGLWTLDPWTGCGPPGQALQQHNVVPAHIGGSSQHRERDGGNRKRKGER